MAESKPAIQVKKPMRIPTLPALYCAWRFNPLAEEWERLRIKASAIECTQLLRVDPIRKISVVRDKTKLLGFELLGLLTPLFRLDRSGGAEPPRHPPRD